MNGKLSYQETMPPVRPTHTAYLEQCISRINNLILNLVLVKSTQNSTNKFK